MKNRITFSVLLLCFCIALMIFSCGTGKKEYSRGIGVYPGNPNQDFAPEIYIDETTYRNLAFHRPAFNSSSYDYNLTAQLVTDGVKETRMPRWISVLTSNGLLPRRQREQIIDHNPVTSIPLEGSSVWLQLELAGGDSVPQVDKIDVVAMLRVGNPNALGWQCRVLGSDDGKSWKLLGNKTGSGAPGELLPPRRWRTVIFRLMHESIPLKKPVSSRFYRIEFSAPIAERWQVGDISFYNGEKEVEMAPSFTFASAWMSAGSGREWVYVDLGARCIFNEIKLYWIKQAAAGKLQISDDASAWQNITDLAAGDSLTEIFKLESPDTARFVRVLMTKPASPQGYLLSEMEVFGRGSPLARPKKIKQEITGSKMDLCGGSWKVQRRSFVPAGGEMLSQIGFEDGDWVIATVPATVLVSYLNNGALPDPNYSDNQLMISESFFNSDFWYRREFEIPPSFKNEHIFLNFDGINWKAQVFLNGQKIGRIEGAFRRGKFDISDNLISGTNCLAVLIEKNAHPGIVKEQTYDNPDRNGGVLGADNPTFHASIGWDWIPTIRGRDTGIWNDVYLTSSGTVTIEDPFVTTDLPLPDTSSVNLKFEVTLQNHDTAAVEGVLKGSFGEVRFAQPVILAASEHRTVLLDSTTHAALHLKNPRLWWPNGYGKQKLYPVNLRFEIKNRVSDVTSFLSGVRELSYSEADTALRIWINGRRFIGRGGNWGFPESMLRYRGREYDAAVRYHKEMNFTLIRNWVGQTGDKEFYEACDRYGIMIWQDFWLANPVDGPNPYDPEMFMDNVKDYVKRIRNHPSLVLYCGRNEGSPPQELDEAIRASLAKFHPRIHYISNSADGSVSGHGPYRAMPLDYYFEQRRTRKLHSEMGMPNMVTFESLQEMMPDSCDWPISRMWGIHDFCQGGAMNAASFIEMERRAFGELDNAKTWTALAQWINYDGYRSMYEAQAKHRMGLVIWMSHPAWPSMVWQTYDYYLEPTAAYFGAKRANEPLHIQLNHLTGDVEVVNYNAGKVQGVVASAELLNLEGSPLWQSLDTLDIGEDSIRYPFKITYPDSSDSVLFIRLKLQQDDKLVSENFYWHGLEDGNYRALYRLPKIKIEAETKVQQHGDIWHLSTRLHNPTAYPALMIRLKVIREKSGDRILPVIYSDNYLFLMPGEQRTIKMELKDADTRGEKPMVVVSGFNVEEDTQEDSPVL